MLREYSDVPIGGEVFLLTSYCKLCKYSAVCAPTGPVAMFHSWVRRDTNRHMTRLARTKTWDFDVMTATRNIVESEQTLTYAARLYGKLPKSCELYEFVQKWGRPHGGTGV